tara:strand:+ start:2957 stop:3256 length:300 start_codon:yes stop_codon:yes gene_type:complete
MSKKYDEVKISTSDRDKKFKAVFYLDGDKKKTLHFGAKGMSDFTINKDPKRKENYLARHKVRENWKVPDTAGSLSRWILWNKPSLKESLKDYKNRFKLK